MAFSPAYEIRNVRLSEVIASTNGGGGKRPLAPGEVIVATAQPEECDPAMDSTLVLLLSEDEKARMDRFRFDRDRRLFLLSHGLLRMTLSLYARVEPHAWQFRTGEHGRPEIAEPFSRLRFNISHTRGLAACAIVLDSDIGFDVEETSKDVPIDNLESFFSAREAEALRSTPSEGHRERFFTYWTLKEAYIKARGVGLSI